MIDMRTITLSLFLGFILPVMLTGLVLMAVK